MCRVVVGVRETILLLVWCQSVSMYVHITEVLLVTARPTVIIVWPRMTLPFDHDFNNNVIHPAYTSAVVFWCRSE